MRRSILVALALSLVLVLGACGGGELVAGAPSTVPVATVPVSAVPATSAPASSAPPATDPGPTTTGRPTPAGDTAQLMAAALQRLVDDEGELPGSTATFLVRRAIDRYAGVTGGDSDGEDTVDPAGGCCGRPLTDEELAAIEAALAPSGTVQFIDDAAEGRTADGLPAAEGGVILGVGEPDIDGDTALIPVSMWCGSLCGTYLSYRADRTPDGWRIVGPDGPIAVS